MDILRKNKPHLSFCPSKNWLVGGVAFLFLFSNFLVFGVDAEQTLGNGLPSTDPPRPFPFIFSPEKISADCFFLFLNEARLRLFLGRILMTSPFRGFLTWVLDLFSCPFLLLFSSPQVLVSSLRSHVQWFAPWRTFSAAVFLRFQPFFSCSCSPALPLTSVRTPWDESFAVPHVVLCTVFREKLIYSIFLFFFQIINGCCPLANFSLYVIFSSLLLHVFSVFYPSLDAYYRQPFFFCFVEEGSSDRLRLALAFVFPGRRFIQGS